MINKKMVSFDTVYFGARLWIWLYFSIICLGSILFLIYHNRERLKKAYYTFRFAEKVVKVVIHYKSGLYKIYYRLIPDHQLFIVDKKAYVYDEDVVTKEHDLLVARQDEKKQHLLIVKNLFIKTDKKGKELIHIGDTEKYEFHKLFSIKHKGKKYPEIHYTYNYPYPIKFDIDTGDLEFSADTLKKFQETDIFNKLLTLQSERMFMLVIAGICFFNLLISLFVVSKMMGWIK